MVSRQRVERHLRPDDLDRLFNSPPIGVGVGVLCFLACLALTRSLAAAATLPFGNFLGLVFHERVHSRHHHRHERLGLGVTSPVFDHAFGSHADPAQVAPSPTVRTRVPTAK